MRLTYSPEADALALELVPDGQSAQTLTPLPGVQLDVDAGGRVIALEIRNASTWYDREVLGVIGTPEELLTLKEAAKESGLDPATLRHQIRNGRLPARKRGHDWYVARHALWNYLEARKPSGRRPRKKRSPAGVGR